jgi:hypothetical protein
MPRISTIQTNFTAGEISPRLRGRTDIDRYNNAAKVMTNCHPVIHGGAVRRAGTRFAQAAKLSGSKAARTIPFVINKDTAYTLEVGDSYVRIFSPSGVYTGIELVSPYTAAMLPDIDFCQGADTMFMFHPQVRPYRLRRFSSSSFDLSAAPFTVEPFDEQGHTPAATLTLSATSGLITVTASAAVFLASDDGRNLVSSAGVGQVVSYTDSTHISVLVSVPFASTTVASGAWSLDVSPQGFVKTSAKDPAGSVVTLYGSVTRPATLTLTAKSGAITIDASASVFVAGDTGKILYADVGQVTLTYVSATQCTGTTSSDFASLSYAPGSWGITGDVWRSGDSGSFVRVNGGLFKITSVTSSTEVVATILTASTSLIAAPPLSWSLEQPVWSSTNGYPRTGTLHEQRLWCAGSTKYPQTLWGSKTGLYLDFTKGVLDTDSVSFTIASDEVNPISFLAASRVMLVHTYGGEFTLEGVPGKAITPTGVSIKPQSSHGSTTVRPLNVGRESVFVQRAGRKVRAMAYQLNIDGYQAQDLTILAEHITASGVVSMAYQQEPDQLLWLVLGDGSMITCTMDRDQQVTGWAHHYTDGAFEWVSSIPISGGEQVWCIVRRRVNGTTVRYVEWFDSTFAPMLPTTPDPNAFPPFTDAAVYGCTVDSGVTVDNVSGQTVFTGLGHLEGKTVDVIADGSVLTPKVVTSGQITLSRASFRTLIGLHFESTLTMLTPEVGTGTGTAQGNSVHTGEVTLKFLNTVGAKVLDGEGREQEVPFRHFGLDVLDVPPPLFTGNVRIEMLGWERGKSEISIVQDQPLPMHLLAVVRKITVND